MTDSNMMRRALNLLERTPDQGMARGPMNPDDVSYDYQMNSKGEINKVVANLRSYDSGRYTKLGRNLKRIERLEEKMKALREHTKQEARDLVASLFEAEDAALTRVVETVSFTFHMTKDPKETVSVKYAQVLKELQDHLTPELLSVMEALVAKHSSDPIQKAAALTATDKAAQRTESLQEGLGDKLKSFFQKMLDQVLSWGKSYDAKLDRLKAEVGMSEGVDEAERPNMFTDRTGSYQVSLKAPDGKTMSQSFYVKNEADALKKAETWANQHKEHGKYGPWEASNAVGPMMGTTYDTNPQMRGEVSESDDPERAAFKRGMDDRRAFAKTNRQEGKDLKQCPFSDPAEQQAWKDGWNHWASYGDTGPDGFEMRGKPMPY